MTKYTQISLKEREQIYLYLREGKSKTEIASSLGRHKSTISREIRRNCSPPLGYLPDRANNFAAERKNKLVCKIERDKELKSYLIERLTLDKWSPQTIAARIKMEGKLPNISHEAIYQYIYGRHGQKLELYQSLMHRRQNRQEKFSRRNRCCVDPQYKINSRPECVNKRAVFGHWEADLTFFSGSKSGNFIVFTERLTRITIIVKNDSKHSNAIIFKLFQICRGLKRGAVKSITFDNGGEFRKFAPLTLMGIKVYFCDPGAPYQKGQVERTNALLHKFIPKKLNFNLIFKDDVQHAQDKLNNLPRKCLNYLTPNEAWAHYYPDVALQT